MLAEVIVQHICTQQALPMYLSVLLPPKTEMVQECLCFAQSRSGLQACPPKYVCAQDMDVPAAIKDADSTREAQLLESWKAYKKGFQEGIALFNKKPKKGIAFMQVCCDTCSFAHLFAYHLFDASCRLTQPH